MSEQKQIKQLKYSLYNYKKLYNIQRLNKHFQKAISLVYYIFETYHAKTLKMNEEKIYQGISVCYSCVSACVGVYKLTLNRT